MIKLANHTSSTKILVISLLLIGFTIGESKAEACFAAQPYVVHATQNSVQVIWVTPAGTDAGKVYVGKTDGSGRQSVVAELSTPLFQDRNADEMELDHLRHLVKLQNLEPYTRYHYEVHCGDGETTRKGTFMTTPLPGERVPFEFAVVADGHVTSGYGTRIAEPVGALKPDFVIHAGDLRGGRGHDWDPWRWYFGVARPYLESSVFIPVVGNHDVNPARNFRSLFAFNDPEGEPSEEDEVGTYYTYKYGNLLVILLDMMYDHDEQLVWLEQVLSESEAEWIIVSTHRSPLNIGGRGVWFPDDFYKDLVHLFEKYGVDLVITGHDHIYERRIPIGSPGVKPVHYITINSNGGRRTTRPSPVVAGGIGKEVFMFTHFRVNGNHLEMEARATDGTVIDRLELIKDEYGMYQDEVMRQAVDMNLAEKLAHIYTGQSFTGRLGSRTRTDIKGSFPSLPSAGEVVTLKLNTGYSGDHEYDVSRFPIGSELIVYAQDEKTGWRTDKQIIEVRGDRTKIQVTAPNGLTHDEDGFNIPLKLHLNIRVDGREFEPVVVWPTIVETEVSEKLEKLELLQPEHNETVESKPVLIWDDEWSADDYHLQVGSPSLEEIIIDTVVTEARFEFSKKLVAGDSYGWRVRGRNDFFEGPWSDEFIFYIFEETTREDIDDVTFGEVLLPAHYALNLPEVTTGGFDRGFRGSNTIYTWLNSDEKLSLRVSGGQHNDSRGGNVRFALYTNIEDTVIVDYDESVPPDGEWYDITLESPYSGLHQLTLDDGDNRTLVEWPEGHPMTVLASKEDPFIFERNTTLYFYVPEETQFVSGDLRRHYRVSFHDTDGNELTGWQNLEEESGYFSITVPEGQSGGLWRFRTTRGNTLRLMSVPPYLARNERELLLPKEVLGISEPTVTESYNDLPTDIDLDQNYPNPFNPSTRIAYSVASPSHVQLSVYNLIGQRVATLVNEDKSAGRHEVTFDATGLSSGMYLYQLRTDTHILSRQMLLVK